MTYIIIYCILGLLTGIVIAWLIRTVKVNELKKLLKSKEGFLESEKLKNDTLKSENTIAHQMKQTCEIDLSKKLTVANAKIKQLDSDILLLQKNNEETEKLFNITNPEIDELKKKLIAANNTIARYKSQFEKK